MLPSISAQMHAGHLTGVNFPTCTEFSCLVDILAIEGVAVAGAHSANLWRQKPDNNEKETFVHRIQIHCNQRRVEETLILAALMEVR